MGFLIDSSIFIAAERNQLPWEEIARKAGDEQAALAAITASELLHGVHRADSPLRRRRREELVELVLAAIPIIPFDLGVARSHAALWADMSRRGLVIGAHDLLIAATALARDLTVATRDRRHFPSVEELRVALW